MVPRGCHATLEAKLSRFSFITLSKASVGSKTLGIYCGFFSSSVFPAIRESREVAVSGAITSPGMPLSKLIRQQERPKQGQESQDEEGK